MAKENYDLLNQLQEDVVELYEDNLDEAYYQLLKEDLANINDCEKIFDCDFGQITVRLGFSQDKYNQYDLEYQNLIPLRQNFLQALMQMCMRRLSLYNLHVEYKVVCDSNNSNENIYKLLLVVKNIQELKNAILMEMQAYEYERKGKKLVKK